MSKLKAKPPSETKPGKSKILIYGASGVGKTWFSLDFPRPFYFDTEGGADRRHYQAKLQAAGGGYMGPADGTLSFDTLLEQMQALATEEHEYQTLIVDSITKIYQSAIAQENERLLSSGQKDEFGSSKRPAVRYMRRLVNWVQRMDMNVVFIAHEAAEWGVVKGERSEIGKIADVWEKLVYELDLGLWCVKNGPQRLARVKKSRLLGFPESESFPLDYSEFAVRYGKDFIEEKPKAIALATPEQVAEIKRLLEVVREPEENVAKWLTKGRAESWEEMPTEATAACINFLKKKIEKAA